MDMTIKFPGGRKVAAEFDGFTVATDQPVEAGGEGSAPAPFDLFLASLGTCAGLFVLSFLQKRGLTTEGLELRQSAEWDDVAHRVTRVKLTIRLPKGFPEKYRKSVVSVAELCTVKKHLVLPPVFEVATADAVEA
ncbi:MAG: OsmC family protein [Elusimicrobia bacterium]|nr:OsmC family protein [Elusimicrobiota bacterium]